MRPSIPASNTLPLDGPASTSVFCRLEDQMDWQKHLEALLAGVHIQA